MAVMRPRRAVCLRVLPLILLWVGGIAAASAAPAEDGYDLWLRYRPIEEPWATRYRATLTQLVASRDSATLLAAATELERGVRGLLGTAPPRADGVSRDGALVVGTPRSLPMLAQLSLPLPQPDSGGFVIRSATLAGRSVLIVAAPDDIGVLYGVFHLLRLMQTRQTLERLDLREVPRIQLRVLNHWDNLDRTVERGYAGQSLWDWHKLPDYVDPRYIDYARANASLGINATVLTNVNAKAIALSPLYLRKAAAVADALRPYGIRVFLTARFAAPIEIGGLKTADPADAAVKQWWQAKVAEVYRAIPDFGGLLVKANSEGQPGPQDYGRSHADGANMLAAALAPFGGVVMWRTFVYSNESPDDRAKQAYSEFVPLDGQFHDNVLLQVKNGPIDFQPREPFHPLFGAMPRTPLMLEVQITKEYLGFATHLAYLGTMYEETLRADTHARGAGSTVAKVIDGSLHGYRRTGIAGVANIGTDRNWSGSHFDQANWYAFGRLAWNPALSAQDIAREWVRMTFGSDPTLVTRVVDVMMKSRQTVVDYMTPLGLHHLMAEGHHYGPQPWFAGGARADWTPVYFHRADARGLGFDRSASGSNAVAQYFGPVAKRFGDLKTVPDDYLLWFHHAPWDHRLQSGRTLWDELVYRYTRGVDNVREMRKVWDELAPLVDSDRHGQIAAFLRIQEQEATWWRDACIAYFQSVAQRPLPAGYPPPQHSLDYYKALKFPYAPGH
jgi:alpha-glucuronidase